MVRLTRIYTKTGDKGTTALGTGSRVAKHDLRVEAYGTVDEANAAIGLARLHTTDGPLGGEADAMLERIQNDLFDLGADLCTPDDGKERLRIAETQVERLEEVGIHGKAKSGSDRGLTPILISQDEDGSRDNERRAGEHEECDGFAKE